MTEVAFLSFFPRAGMQVLSLRMMTSKLVSLVAQVTYTLLPSGPYLIFHCYREKKYQANNGNNEQDVSVI